MKFNSHLLVNKYSSAKPSFIFHPHYCLLKPYLFYKTIKNTCRRNSLVLLCLMAFFNQPVLADTVNEEQWVSLPQSIDPIFDNLNIPDDAATKGMWSPIYDWPMNGLHAALLPNGKVFTFGTSPDGIDQDGRYYDVWDPTLGFGANAHDSLFDPTRQDSFCSAATYLSDGTLMISGGNGVTSSTLFDTSSKVSNTSTSNLAEPRWYSTMLTLPDGRPIMLGGMVPYTEAMQKNPDQAIASGWPSMTPEVYENGEWRSLFGAYSRLAFGPDYLRTSYPRAWVAPDGRVFGISADQMWYLDPDANQGLGEVVSAGPFKVPFSFNKPVNVGATSTAVMFAPGKILQVGGNGGSTDEELPASNMATVVDINNGIPEIIEQPAMAHPRRYPNIVVLPSGKVVVSGGSTYGNNYNGQPSSPVYSVEIWGPDSHTASDSNAASHYNTFIEGASAATFRGYHSITTLLANGTILSTGGGTPGPVTNLNAEIFYPPSLFKKVGEQSQLAPRPFIAAISGLSYKNEATLQLDMNSETSISQLVLIGNSSGTHSFNTGQRRIPLSFSQDRFRLTTTLPNRNLAPPGYYQVVAINSVGTPSKGVIIGIGQDQAEPPVDPIPYSPPKIEDLIDTPAIRAGEQVTYSFPAEDGTLYRWSFSDDGRTTDFSADPEVNHVYTEPGLYVVTVTAESQPGMLSTKTFVQAVSTPSTEKQATSSSLLAYEKRDAQSDRLWVVNPDNDSVSVIAVESNNLISEISVGVSPRSIAIAPDGFIWVTNKSDATITVIDPYALVVIDTIPLPIASQPYGITFSPDGSAAYVVLEASGQLLKLDPGNGVQLAAADIGMHARHVAVKADSSLILVTRFITPPLPGESTTNVNTNGTGGEVLSIDPASMTIDQTILLQYSHKADTEIQGSGIPNYLSAPAISPDGSSAWIPSKQDNITRGIQRSGQPLNFQNTVRAISSKIDLVNQRELLEQRVDHDNSSVAAAAAFHPNGVYLFVALESSREVAVVNAINGSELFRISVGIAPQSLAISHDGLTLYVKELIERRISVIDLKPLIHFGRLTAHVEAVINTVLNEKLDADVLAGKALFYDAKDPRLAKDSYLSCASCHNDGDQDGRVWDLTAQGEGLRNTIALNGRAGMSHGLLHWSGNFDEVQDFEAQIRSLSGGTGLMSDADFNSGSRRKPLGDTKSGVSEDLDHLAAYIHSLNQFAPSPLRNMDETMTSAAVAGKSVFLHYCTRCHGTDRFTLSDSVDDLKDIGTITSATGSRSGGPINGIDIPTLIDAWFTAPYLHDGSAATLEKAIQTHGNINLNPVDLNTVVAYVQQIGNDTLESNLAPVAVADTSYVSFWDSLSAVNDNITPSSSSDTSHGAYGNWEGILVNGKTNWVSFSWPTTKALTAFEVYWWDNGSGIDKPQKAEVEYWDGSAWISLGPIGTQLNNFNRIEFRVTTNMIRVSMSSKKATGILEARVMGYEAPVNEAPSIALTTPEANITVTDEDTLSISANAQDQDGKISKVEFYADYKLLATDYDPPFNFDWSNIDVGNYNLYAKAYDDSMRVSTTPATPVIVIPFPNEAPNVNLTAPTGDIWTFKWMGITIAADAVDSDGNISKVEFYANGHLIHSDSSAPYRYKWWPLFWGKYKITVKAYDNRSVATTSNAVHVTFW